MLRNHRWIICCAAAMGALALPAFAQTPEEISKIKEALPKSATTKPVKKRKLLVFSLATGFKHDSIPYGEKAFDLMGEATGAYEATLSKDMSVFEPANLRQFDAILMNNTTGELFTTPSLQKSLLDFVKNGKGFAGIHSSSDCCYNWPSYGDLIGGYFDGHPWTAKSQVTVKLDEPNHPIMKAFGGAGFDITDEIYQFKDPFSRHKLRVLASLDNDKTDMNKDGLKRADKDFAISWVRKYGKGRVFYCSLGHNKHIFHDSRVLQHYLDGIQFALGDLKADAEPVADIALEKQNMSLDVAEAGLKDYDYGKAEPASAIFDSLTRGTSEAADARRQYVARLVAVATNPEYSVAARELTLRQIPYLANENDVEKLLPLLKDSSEKIAEMTRYALAPIAGESISKTFREIAGSTTNENLKAGLISALGTRGDKGSVKFITDHAKDSSEVVASAAINALGNIGTQESASSLRTLFDKAEGNLKEQVGSALAKCASSLATSGKRQAARTIYSSLLKETGSHDFRLAAFVGQASLSSNPSEVALETLLSETSDLHAAAGTLLVTADDGALNDKLARAIKGQKPETQVALLGIAKARQAKQAIEPARALLSSETTPTRSAAIVALGTIGDATVVADLLKVAANKDDEFADQARASLDQLATEGIDELLIKSITPSGSGETNDAAKAEIAEAIQALGRRSVTNAVPALLENAKLRKDNLLQGESYEVLAKLARAEDAKTLLELNYQIKSKGVRTKAERALLAAINKMQPEDSRASFLVDAIESAPSSDARVSILKLLGKLGGDESYEALKKYLPSDDETIKDTAIRALADFPTPQPLNDLIAIARDESADKVHKVLALRGAVRMLGLESKRKQDETAELAKTLLDLATTDEDRKLVISQLADIRQPGIFELIVPSLETEALAAEARAAILKLAPHVWGFAPAETSQTLSRLSEADLTDAQNEELKKISDQMAGLTSAVVGWQVSGPYSDPSAQTPEKLLAHKFKPEAKGMNSVEWKFAGVGSEPGMPEVLDLEKIIGGANKSVAYIRSYLIAETDTTAELLIGSDDGIKVWVNSEEVLSAPIERGYNKGADKVKVSLKKGQNELLAKVSQGGGSWHAGILVESPDGGAIEGLRIQTVPLEGK